MHKYFILNSSNTKASGDFLLLTLSALGTDYVVDIDCQSHMATCQNSVILTIYNVFNKYLGVKSDLKFHF